MSDTTIATLRAMLANLDDAKKYQSLRDVMSTLPAPDLAAVFEDLDKGGCPPLTWPPCSRTCRRRRCRCCSACVPRTWQLKFLPS